MFYLLLRQMYVTNVTSVECSSKTVRLTLSKHGLHRGGNQGQRTTQNEACGWQTGALRGTIEYAAAVL